MSGKLYLGMVVGSLMGGEFFIGELSGVHVQIPKQDYVFYIYAAIIWAILVNRQTAPEHLYYQLGQPS